MEKTSKITRSVFKTDFESKYGKMYNHLITCENGDTGTVVSKEKEPEKLNPGKEITYTIEETDYGFKLKLVTAKQEGQQGGWQGNKKPASNWQPADPRIQNIGFAMAYAKDLAVADKIKVDALEATFETIYSAMDKKFLQIKGELPNHEPKENKPEPTGEKSTPEQYKRAEKILNEGTLFSKEERKASLEVVKAATKEGAEKRIAKIQAESDNRKQALLKEEEEVAISNDDLPF